MYNQTHFSGLQTQIGMLLADYVKHHTTAIPNLPSSAIID